MYQRNAFDNRAGTPLDTLGHLTSDELLRLADDSTDPLTRALARHLDEALGPSDDSDSATPRAVARRGRL